MSQLATALAGRYGIERELGHGGMATVYLAQDLKHDRPVAVKVLHPELAHALGPERFLREITFTAQFDHPYILPLLDSGVVEPQPAIHGPEARLTPHAARLLYYVMPYVVGESLRDRMTRQKQLPVDDALQVAREVAEALAYAHARGVIHRDIKPENILMSGGHARVADFGIARAIDAAGSERLTETGLAVGTPAYMSPEQSMAERDIDGRSDLYALGCVLYEMLAGEPPYTGPTAQAIIAKRMTNPAPSVRTLRETVPEPVDRALTRVLARAPADRFPTATQFAEALDMPATATPLSGATRSATKRTYFVGVAILGMLALLGGWLLARSRHSPVVPSASVIAVLPFLPSSPDSALARLGRDLVLTVSANLDGVGGIRAADPRRVLADEASPRRGTADDIALGQRLGAGSVVVGDLVRVGQGIRLDLKLVPTTGDSSPLARVSLAGVPDSISALTDSITWALLRQVWRRGEPPSPSYANLTTRSVASLRAFLEGEQFMIAGRWPEAIDAYAAAIAADSTFWLAGWRFNWAQGWVLEGEENADLQRGYESHLASFGERDRMLIQVDMEVDTVTFLEHLARHRRVVEKFPEDWAAWFSYADLMTHYGPLAGYTGAEARAAMQRTVELNPKLVPMWEHLFASAIGHDSSQAALALQALIELGAITDGSASRGDDATLGPRLLLAAGGPVPPTLLDSFAAGLFATKEVIPRVLATGGLRRAGNPAAQIELNRRLLAHDPHGPFTQFEWENNAQSWITRGAWDSALVALDHWDEASADLRVSFDRAIPPLTYQLAVAGAWLGGLDTERAAARRGAAVRYLAGLPDTSRFWKIGQARVAWADGMLAVIRRDPRALGEARVRLRQSGRPEAAFMDRSLAGFGLELTGARRAAAESLAALDLDALDFEIGDRHDPYARSLTHLAASRWLLEQGDTSRAVKLLAWHEADIPASPEGFRSQVFAGLAYYELARIEEAQGHTDLAREHYGQFLRRFDMPPPQHQYLVDNARAALKRMAEYGDQPKAR